MERRNIGQREGKPYYFIFRLLHFIFMLCSITALFPVRRGGKGRDRKKKESKKQAKERMRAH